MLKVFISVLCFEKNISVTFVNSSKKKFIIYDVYTCDSINERFFRTLGPGTKYFERFIVVQQTMLFFIY